MKNIEMKKIKESYNFPNKDKSVSLTLIFLLF